MRTTRTAGSRSTRSRVDAERKFVTLTVGSSAQVLVTAAEGRWIAHPVPAGPALWFRHADLAVGPPRAFPTRAFPTRACLEGHS